MKYLIVVEPALGGYSAYCPDVPGCVAASADQDTVITEMTRALAFHLAGLREEGEPTPSPMFSTYVEVPRQPAK